MKKTYVDTDETESEASISQHETVSTPPTRPNETDLFMAQQNLNQLLMEFNSQNHTSFQTADLEAAVTMKDLRDGNKYENPNPEFGKALRRLIENRYGLAQTTHALRRQETEEPIGRIQRGHPRPAARPSTEQNANTLRSIELNNGRLGPNMPIPRSDHATAMAVYNSTLAKARARHAQHRVAEYHDGEDFSLEDIHDALTLTNLHKGLAFGLDDFLDAVAFANHNRGTRIQYTIPGLVHAFNVLWGVDFGYLVFRAGRTESAREEVRPFTDTRARRVSPRQRDHDSLNYDARYHPMDDVVRPSRARRLRNAESFK